MQALLGQKLLKGSEEVDTASLKGGVVALYFSAHWCPPCKAFTPEFCKVYKRCKEQGKSFDVVFVSSDQTEAQFREYYATMPWHALPYSNRMLQQALGQKFGVRGIPAVILLDASGNLRDANGRSKVMAPSFPSTLPRALNVDNVIPLVEGPVVLRVHHRRAEYELEVDPEDGWEVLRMQLYSITEVPSEQQRLFGLGIEKGPLDETIPLSEALALAIDCQKKSESHAWKSESPDKPPSIIVIGNWSQGDPFEVNGTPPTETDVMIKEQQLAFLQAKLSSAPPRLQHQASSLQHVFKYDELDLQRQALDQIPVVRIHDYTKEKIRQKGTDPEGGFELAFMTRLVQWFKSEFFQWTNSPKCETCGGETQGVGGAAPTEIEKSFGAGSVEVSQCKLCGAMTRFPRYNHPGKLLESRQGRCGEWANCFTLIARAVGYEARHVHDWTDHVWTEFYCDTFQRWVHVDACEASVDNPLLYEQGWGKKLTYCLAFGRDSVVDATKRYTKNFPELLTRRSEFSEEQLQRVMSALDEFALDRSVSSLTPPEAEERRALVAKRAEAEAQQFATVAAKEVKEGEQIGRITGDKNWREQRGELGANAEAKARALGSSATAPVPGSWINSAENYALKDGVLTSDLRRADGTWNRGVSIRVEIGGSYSNEDGSFALSRDTVHQMRDITSSVNSDAFQPHESITVQADLEQLTIACRWKDQGAGNQKGRLQLVLSRGKEILSSQECFGTAPHSWETKSKSFSASELKNPRSGDVVKIEYVVGGGGGHQLHVEDLKVSLVRKPSENKTPAVGSSSGYPCSTPTAPVTAAVSSSTHKAEMQNLVKKAFAELVATGMSPTEAAVKAIEKAKKEQLAVLMQKKVAELVASGMSPTEAALKAIEHIKKQAS